MYIYIYVYTFYDDNNLTLIIYKNSTFYFPLPHFVLRIKVIFLNTSWIKSFLCLKLTYANSKSRRACNGSLPAPCPHPFLPGLFSTNLSLPSQPHWPLTTSQAGFSWLWLFVQLSPLCLFMPKMCTSLSFTLFWVFI